MRKYDGNSVSLLLQQNKETNMSNVNNLKERPNDRQKMNDNSQWPIP